MRGSLLGLPLLVPPADFALGKLAWTALNSSPQCKVVVSGLAGIAGGISAGPGSSVPPGCCRGKGGPHVGLVEPIGGSSGGNKVLLRGKPADLVKHRSAP